MKHSSTQSLFAYWDIQRGARIAPERGDIEPAAIRNILGDTFVLASDFVDEHRFRLAGTKVCALFGHELKAEAFTKFWNETSRPLIRHLLSVVSEEQIGMVAGVTGRTLDNSEMELELIVLPLAYHGLARIRALGALSPISPPYWMGVKPLTELELGAMRHVGPQARSAGAPRLIRPHEGSRVRHGFVVYDGGREPAA